MMLSFISQASFTSALVLLQHLELRHITLDNTGDVIQKCSFLCLHTEARSAAEGKPRRYLLPGSVSPQLGVTDGAVTARLAAVRPPGQSPATP